MHSHAYFLRAKARGSNSTLVTRVPLCLQAFFLSAAPSCTLVEGGLNANPLAGITTTTVTLDALFLSCVILWKARSAKFNHKIAVFSQWGGIKTARKDQLQGCSYMFSATSSLRLPDRKHQVLTIQIKIITQNTLSRFNIFVYIHILHI